MQVYYCPIDTSLSFSQANILIRDLKPSHLVVAESYMSPPPLAPQRTDLVIEWVRRCFHFLLFIVYMHFPTSGRRSGNSCFPMQNSDLGFHGQLRIPGCQSLGQLQPIRSQIIFHIIFFSKEVAMFSSQANV